MKNNKIIAIFSTMILTVFGVATIIYAQQQKHQSADKSHDDCPMMKMMKDRQAKTDGSKDKSSHKDHSNHLAMVNERGEKAMGFSQTKTTHHFLLREKGGVIQVEVNDPKDEANLNNIREHLRMIARMFTEGNFETPFAVHAQVPPGVPEMKQLKSAIKYEYKETKNGAGVHISTDNPNALAAIHNFLRFQIEDHQTGDPLTVGR